MDLHLEPSEARVLGVLIEKQLTTPDGYPLSLNALQSGCNQKSNRHPLMQMAEGEVFSSVERLRMQQLAGAVHPAGSRVEKFQHTASERLGVDEPSLAVLAELLLRGPQQPGELRTRASRMSRIDSQDDLRGILARLTDRGMVHEVPPEPGGRARRYATTLVDPPAERAETRPAATPASSPPPARPEAAALAPARSGGSELEERVARLERRLAHLAESLGESLPD